MELPLHGKVWHTSLDKSGRVLLPAELRHQIQTSKDVDLVWTCTDDGFKLQAFESLLASIQQYYQSLAPKDEVWSEELLKERRDEAARE